MVFCMTLAVVNLAHHNLSCGKTISVYDPSLEFFEQSLVGVRGINRFTLAFLKARQTANRRLPVRFWLRQGISAQLFAAVEKYRCEIPGES